MNGDGTIDFDELINPIIDIPLGVYIPKYDDIRGIYLSRTNNFEYLKEYYLLDKFEDYVIKSFNESNKSMGVLYLGLKGSGKTKRAHKLALDSGLPVLYLQDLSILNKSAWKDMVGTDIFNNFVIFIDEYEKKLEEATTVALLEWLDGSSNNKQLFILIGNEKANNKFSNPLLDRLSRVLWRKTFGSLKESEVIELVNKLSIRDNKEETIESIISIPVLSLDNIIQIIEITNLFKDDSVEDVIAMLNIEFNKYDEFYICDEFNNKISDYPSSLSISIKKSGINFFNPDIYETLNTNYIDKLLLTNKDINSDKTVYIDLEYKDLDIKCINKNKLIIKVFYKYDSLESGIEDVVSTEAITLYLLKESYYESLIFNTKFLEFKNAL